MQNGMSLEDLLTEVKRQTGTKRDFVTSTKDEVRLVDQDDQIRLILLREGAIELERFEIAENAHRQIAQKLGIPWKYYDRLCVDHRDLVITQVNALFEREPSSRMIRVLDDKVRAFLSDRYKRLDNDEVLQQVLPPFVKGDIESTLLNSNVGADRMNLKVLFTSDDLTIDLGPMNRPFKGWAGGDHDVSGGRHEVIRTRDAGRDIVRPGIHISNSECGNGSLKAEGFLYRAYCENGLIWGTEKAFEFSRTHVGGKVVGDDESFEVFSDETRRKEDELIIAQLRDTLGVLTDPARVRQIGERLRAAQQSEKVQDSFAAVDQLAELVDVREGEKQGILESFLQDGDFSKWGMVNAVTEQANSEEISYERATELEQIGGQILSLNDAQWNRIAFAEKVAA